MIHYLQYDILSLLSLKNKKASVFKINILLHFSLMKFFKITVEKVQQKKILPLNELLLNSICLMSKFGKGNKGRSLNKNVITFQVMRNQMKSPDIMLNFIYRS